MDARSLGIKSSRKGPAASGQTLGASGGQTAGKEAIGTMKTKIIMFISTTILFGCSSTSEKVTRDEIAEKRIILKKYYPEGNVMRTSEMTVDSVLDGLTLWYDSLGTKYSEQIYSNGKLTGTSKSYYKNGLLAKETEYLDNKIIKEKEYHTDGTLTYQNPIDVKDIGKIHVIIANNTRQAFRKNQADTVMLFADNLPLTNKGISVRNAKIVQYDKDEYILTPLNNSKYVTIIFLLKKGNDIGNQNFEPIDSTYIEIE